MAQAQSPTIQVEETQYDANKEPYVLTPATPCTRPDPAQTPPLGPVPTLPSQVPVPQSPSQESDDGSSEHSGDGSGEERCEEEKVDPHVLPQFDWERLEAEYLTSMNRANDVEAKLGDEFRALANFFAQWSNVSLAQDEERAAKRFRTRQEHVYHSEDKFSKKKNTMRRWLWRLNL
ncbi:hypothetical protein GMDG_07306 [Pseudogymnoascus destructans 20631-21]|uniref:Uncharacterized protein n=1 Tax=Pseudogymnoascus destructans (strain ATCC MYA-4855 / 20631-21) TaxID=658429 RepID=L8FXU2_PSED2|nr:hypothetical protein GMDG_07306 [Pseudogymnoascus destructans 20631-21]